MSLFYIFKLAIINILSKKLRAILTMSGVGISICMIVYMSGLGFGLENLVNVEMKNSESVNIITATSLKNQQLKITKDQLLQFKAISGVNQVEPIVNFSGDAQFHGITQTIPIYGTTSSYLESLGLNYVSGTNFKTGDEKAIIVNTAILKSYNITNANDIFDRELAIDLSFNRNLVTDAATTKIVPNLVYKVVGVINKGDTPLAYVPVDYLYTIGIKAVSQAKVYVTDSNRISGIREAIEILGFKTSNIKDTFGQAEKILNILRILLIVLGAITFLVAIFSILNTITIVLMEQTKNIGFLRIMGIRQNDVKVLLYTQSIILSLGGTMLGLLWSAFLGYLTNLRVTTIANQINLPNIRLYEPSYIIIIASVIASIIVGLLVGVIPARRAIKIDPLVALRD